MSASLLIFSAGCDNLDFERDASYRDMSAVIANGAVARGWIPTWVPANATDLHEVHDLDTNESMLLFHVPAAHLVALPQSCEPISANSTARPMFEREWWPLDATSREDYRIYQCARSSPAEFVAISGSGGVVLHWRAHAR